ncbi:MAG: ribosomal-protein-serine acetyltransferase [Opitutae bacterium]|nr:ribosomal-protein-serine acetyltransferase [Opitutae bacterium]
MSLFSPNPKSGYLVLGDFFAQFRNYKISPIHMDDALPIMNWRNQQISALRQNKPLLESEQVRYFRNVVSPGFGQQQPEQILLRFTHRNTLIGYGGLVHIDWPERIGEVSFLLETERAKDMHNYGMECSIFLQLLKKCAFDKLDFNKIYTESYSHRPWHVMSIEAAGFRREKVLPDQATVDGKSVDAVVASCLKEEYLESLPD